MAGIQTADLRNQRLPLDQCARGKRLPQSHMFVLFFIPLLTYSLLHNSGCKPTFCLNPVNVCFSVTLSLFVFPFHVVFVIVQVIVAAVVVVVEEELKLEPKNELFFFFSFFVLSQR